jgi:capsular polysaccharide biosynthesis protein
MANEQTLNLYYLVSVVRRYFWYLVLVVGLAGLLAIVFTMPSFYPPEFRSSTVIFPTNPERFDGVGLFDEEPTIYLYGDGKSVEKLINIATSEEVMLQVLDSLDLWSSYGINPKDTASAPKYKANRIYSDIMRVVKVGGNGVEISALDVNPHRAAAIVNLVVHLTDKINREMLNANKSRILSIYEGSLQKLKDKMGFYADSASKVRLKYFVFENQGQTEMVVGEVLRAQSDYAAANAKLRLVKARYGADSDQAKEAQMEVSMANSRVYSLTKQSSGTPINLENFAYGIDQITALGDISYRLASKVKEVEAKIDYLNMMDNGAFSTILIVEEAKPADRKSRPIRWIILAAALMISGLVSLIAVVLIDFLTKREAPAKADTK